MITSGSECIVDEKRALRIGLIVGSVGVIGLVLFVIFTCRMMMKDSKRERDLNLLHQLGLKKETN